jgi:hypothetical protein
MPEKNQTRPKNADRRQDQKPIATKPIHARIIPLLRDFKIHSSGIGITIKFVRSTLWNLKTLSDAARS